MYFNGNADAAAAADARCGQTLIWKNTKYSTTLCIQIGYIVGIQMRARMSPLVLYKTSFVQ